MKKLAKLLTGLLVLFTGAVVLVWLLNSRDEVDVNTPMAAVAPRTCTASSVIAITASRTMAAAPATNSQ